MRIYKSSILVSLFLFISLGTYSQDSTNTFKSSNSTDVSVWAFMDIYYGYNFTNYNSHIVGEMVDGSSFIYSHNKNNEFNLNNGIIGLKYSKEKVRAAFSLQGGTYVQANYANEPDALKHVFESYIGYQLAKNWWVDAGIFTSHLGFESPVSFDCNTLSRSMMADNSPYYETGVKVTYEPTSKFLFSALVLNGWQNIVDRNRNKAVGTQLQYKPSDKFLFNYSTFYGKEVAASVSGNGVGSTDSLSTNRFFNNLYLISCLSEKLTITTGVDIGVQKKLKQPGVAFWWTPAAIVKYSLSKKTAVAGRVEYFHDKDGVIVYSTTPNGFQTFATSVNFDYKLSNIVLWRIEGKLFRSKDKVFMDNDKTSRHSILALTSIAIKF